jgi:hypothetical protein
MRRTAAVKSIITPAIIAVRRICELVLFDSFSSPREAGVEDGKGRELEILEEVISSLDDVIELVIIADEVTEVVRS